MLESIHDQLGRSVDVRDDVDVLRDLLMIKMICQPSRWPVIIQDDLRTSSHDLKDDLWTFRDHLNRL